MCGSNKTNFLGHKRLLKTQSFEKKAIFLVKKRFRLIFPRISEHDKHQGTTDRGQQGILKNIVQDKRSFPPDLKS